MTMDQYQKGLQSLYSCTGIPLLILNKKNEELYSSSPDFKNFYAPDFLRSMVEKLMQSDFPEGVLLYCTGGFYYVAFAGLDKNLYLATAIINAEMVIGASARSHTEWCLYTGRFYYF
jgi:hypothetical protein